MEGKLPHGQRTDSERLIFCHSKEATMVLFPYTDEILMVQRKGVADEGGIRENRHGILSFDSRGQWLPRI